MGFLDRYKSEISDGPFLGYENSLDENVERGFSKAVQNNQPALALQYALLLLNDQDSAIRDLQDRVTELESNKKTASSSRSSGGSKSTAKKSASAKDTKEDAVKTETPTESTSTASDGE